MNESRHGFIGLMATAGGTVVSWMPEVNAVIQAVGGIVAIVAGIYTIVYHAKKIRELNK